jgi:hypothetical protein
MPIVILKGEQNRQWNIDGSMKPGGIPQYLTDAQVKKHQDIIERNLDDEVKKSEDKKISVDEVDEQQLKEKELFALNKSEQIKLLNELGITKIPRLESGRVKAILEAQK